MAHFECNTGLASPFPFQFPDEGFPVVFRGKYFAAGAVSDIGIFSCEIDDPEIIGFLTRGGQNGISTAPTGVCPHRYWNLKFLVNSIHLPSLTTLKDSSIYYVSL